MDTVFKVLGYAIYTGLGVIALWGIYCIVQVWRRVAQKQYKTEGEQDEFLDAVEDPLLQGQFDAAVELCMDKQQAMPQLAKLALVNRKVGYQRVRQLVLDRFQRDVLADLEYRLSWVNTVVKSAPMLGLLGTVVGMMGAFRTLATNENVDPTQLAGDINVALRTTACGLAIAIPLIVMMSSVNIRIRKMEDLVSSGLTRFLDAYRQALAKKVRGK
ncbi:MAG TPA: MotA/TolQ/ExbB proton channel family protein [Planctomycetaceae bacterium]|nr:MotA/TolQ/ExbB proton channel family protein [Planctomycetaceae bacterium]